MASVAGPSSSQLAQLETCPIHSYQLVIRPDQVMLTKDGQYVDTKPISYNRTNLKGRTLDNLLKMLRANRLRQDETELLGEYLYSVLLSDTFGESFHADLRAEENAFLRIDLIFEGVTNELTDLPWEYLYRREEGGSGYFLATEDRIALVRRPKGSHVRGLSLKASEGEKLLKVLLVATSPADEPPLEFRAVVSAMEQFPGLQLTTLTTDHESNPILAMAEGRNAAATWDAFLAELASFKPHVVHFLGHGRSSESGGEIAFVGSDFKADWRQGRNLADKLKDHRSVRLAFLQACETAAKGDSAVAYRALSSVASELVQTGIPAIVAMQTTIQNAAANSFAEAFFRAVLEQKQPIFRAMQIARSRSGEAAACIPVLYLGLDKDNTNAQGFLIPETVRSPGVGLSSAGAVPDRPPEPARKCPWCGFAGNQGSNSKRCIECAGFLYCPTCNWRVEGTIDERKEFIYCGGDSPEPHKIYRQVVKKREEPGSFVEDTRRLPREYDSTSPLPKQRNAFEGTA
ncbi:MAG TPA: CHAT domain-containing protein [Bryobacteraceae bacterium]|jgi:CHAT domain-containing protein